MVDYSPLLAFCEDVSVGLQLLAATFSEIRGGQSHDERRGLFSHHSSNLPNYLFDLRDFSMVKDVGADDTIKVAVYERKIPHLVLDKGYGIDRSSFQTAIKGFEGRFRNVKSYYLKSLFAQKYGMTTGPAA